METPKTWHGVRLDEEYPLLVTITKKELLALLSEIEELKAKYAYLTPGADSSPFRPGTK
jgi:hypothetical protein